MEKGDNIDLEKVERLLVKTGKRGAQLLSVLGKQASFVRALESEIGQQLLKDALSITEGLLEKIISEEANESERAEYRALKKILITWAQRVETYQRNLEKLN